MMISISTLLWTIVGATAGGTHSMALRHSAESANPWTPLIGLVRLVVVGVVLTAAAISGFLFSAFAGWIAGFVVTLLVLIQRVK
jgi:hypothetical protein